MRKVYVPVGLPGAGKTTFFNELKKLNLSRIDMDEYINCSLKETLEIVLKPRGDLYLDGLFLSEKVQNILLDTKEQIIFFYFVPDIEKSLLRDKLRNRGQSTNIIKGGIHKPKECILVSDRT